MPLRDPSPEFHLSEVERKAYELLGKKRERIEPDSFIDLYHQETVAEDKARVAGIERQFSPDKTQIEVKKLAELFEVLFSQLVELEDWLGDDVFIVETSKFDDYVNGVDAVAEFLRDGSFSHLGLAIDITFTKDTSNKIQRIFREIRNKQLPRVKYFISEGGDFRGELSNIPRVILGTDRKTLNELAELWLDLAHLKKRKETHSTPELTQRIREIKERMQKHPLQIELLAQIELQLEMFGKYAAQVGNLDIAEKYKNVLSIINKIRDGKKDIEQSPATQTRDMKMFRDIENSINSNMKLPTSEIV